MWHSSVPRETFFTYNSPDKVKLEWMNKHLASQVVRATGKEIHFCIAPARLLRCTAWLEQGQAGRTAAAKTLRGHRREADPTNHFEDPIKKSAQEQLLTPWLQFPQLVHKHQLCSMQVTPWISGCWLPMCNPKGVKRDFANDWCAHRGSWSKSMGLEEGTQI